MSRNWGIPNKDDRRAILDAQTVKPVLTMISSIIFGVIGASIAAMSFAGARSGISGLFHGASLVAVVIAAGFGCWLYIWLARPRFAAQLSGQRDAFSGLIRFYARAAIALAVAFVIGEAAGALSMNRLAVIILCAAGGAGAAAAFQTVLTFVPHYDNTKG